jgi:hypothetical protein
MTALDLATKHCNGCDETKPLSEFYKDRNRRDGRHARCGECAKASVLAYQARKREEIGDEAFREYRRVITARSRARTGNASGRASQAAHQAALLTLRDLHRDQFDALLARERYERGLT